MANININGQYRFTLTIQNMFHTYTSTYTNHNMITSDGLNFLVKKWNGEEGAINKAIFGKGTNNPTENDIINMFVDPYIINISTYSYGNTLRMQNNTVKGVNINGTTELGIIGETEKENQKTSTLISRSTHPVINIPDTCIISFEYVFTLTSITVDECEEEE